MPPRVNLMLAALNFIMRYPVAKTPFDIPYLKYEFQEIISILRSWFIYVRQINIKSEVRPWNRRVCLQRHLTKFFPIDSIGPNIITSHTSTYPTGQLSQDVGELEHQSNNYYIPNRLPIRQANGAMASGSQGVSKKNHPIAYRLPFRQANGARASRSQGIGQ